MKINCPHCYNKIEVIEEATLSDISCPSCGSSFDLVSNENIEDTVRGTYANESRRMGRFELISEVGSGAFGSVWQGKDPSLDRKVAVKIPRKGRLTPAESEMFFREARAAAQLEHPNIVPVHEIGKEDDTVYIVSKFIEGYSLADRLSDSMLTMRDSVIICHKVALALEHAHSKGVIHRDLKPSNIMLDAGEEPYVMDFGLAKRDAGEITMTVEGRILGTPAYMSPEQARGEAHHVDGGTDVYSLGVVLFELLTGEIPFRGNQRMLLHHVIHDEAPSPRKLNASIPKDLETICLKCLQKQPTKRYNSARELADDLDCYLNGKPISARPISPFERTFRWCRRKPALASVIALAATLIGALAIGAPLVALQQSRIAEQNKNIANREKENADQLKRIADQSKKIAEREKENANQQKKIATQQSEFATEQEKLLKLAEQETKQKELALTNLSKETSRQMVRNSWRLHDSGNRLDALSVMGRAVQASGYDENIQLLNRNRFLQMWQKFPITGFWNRARAARFNANLNRIAVGEPNGSVSVWDSEATEIQQFYKPHQAPVLDLAFDKLESLIVSVANDQSLAIFDLKTSSLIWSTETEFMPNEVWFDRAGGIVAHQSTTNEFAYYDLAKSDKPVRKSFNDLLAVNREQSLIASKNENTIEFFEIGKFGEPIDTIELENTVQKCVFSQDGTHVAIVSQSQTDEGKKQYVLDIFDRGTGEYVLRDLKIANAISPMRFSNDNGRLAFGQINESANEVIVVRAEDESDRYTFSTENEITDLRFSGSGKLLAAFTNRGIEVANIERKELRSVSCDLLRNGFISGLTGPDDQFLVTRIGSTGSQTSMWDAKVLFDGLKYEFDGKVEGAFQTDRDSFSVWTGNKSYKIKPDHNIVETKEKLKTSALQKTTFRVETRTRIIQTVRRDGLTEDQESAYSVFVPFTEVVSLLAPESIETKVVERFKQTFAVQPTIDKFGFFKYVAGLRNELSLVHELGLTNREERKFVYRIWNVPETKPLTQNLVFDRAVTSAKFSTNGKFIVFEYYGDDQLGTKKSVRVFEVEQGQPMTDHLPFEGEVYELSQNAERLMLVSGNNFQVVDINNQSEADLDSKRKLVVALQQKRIDEFGELVSSDYDEVEHDLSLMRLEKSKLTGDLAKKWHIAELNWALSPARNNERMLETATRHAIGWRDLAQDEDIPNLILGDIHASLGKHSEALKAFSKAVELNTESIYGWTSLATLTLNNGDEKGFRDVCKKIWDKFQSSEQPFIRNEAVWIQILLSDGDFDGSKFLKIAAENYKQFPNSRSFSNTLIALFLRLGQIDKASEIIAKIGNQYPGHDKPTQAIVSAFKPPSNPSYNASNFPVSWTDELQAKLLSLPDAWPVSTAKER